MSDTWKAFCPEEDVAPFINVTENCFNLTREDFVDANGLNFNLVTGALNKCSSSFAAVYQSIPFDSIGAVGLSKSDATFNAIFESFTNMVIWWQMNRLKILVPRHPRPLLQVQFQPR